jgi:hypothetical protein
MGTALISVIAGAVLLLAAFAYLGWRSPLLDILRFYYRLIRAQHQANRFYAECPWVTKNILYHADLPCRLDVYQPSMVAVGATAIRNSMPPPPNVCYPVGLCW